MAGTRQQDQDDTSWGGAGSPTAFDGLPEVLCDIAECDLSALGLVTRVNRDYEAEAGSAALLQVIQSQIIPRLMLAHKVPMNRHAEIGSPVRRAVSEADVAELARIVVTHGSDVACSFIDALRSTGVTLEQVFIDLITPTAQLLGDMWTEDQTGFTEVTVGLSQLQRILHHYGPEFGAEQAKPRLAKRALLMAMPGDGHTFGISIVEEFFRRAGWDVDSGRYDTRREMMRAVRNESYDFVGISVSCDLLMAELTSAINELRRQSRNTAVRIYVGGRLFNEHPELASTVGADGTAADARQLILQLGLPQTTSAPATR